jgi:diguanylate cyclase (GGDEF)-like protein/PAS domain S-box-containing protein
MKDSKSSVPTVPAMAAVTSRRNTRKIERGSGPESGGRTSSSSLAAARSDEVTPTPLSHRETFAPPPSEHSAGLELEQMLDHLYEGAYLVDSDDEIVYWNAAAEQITGYAAAEVVGRSCADGILVHSDDRGTCMCGHHCPRRSALHTGLCTETATFLRHKEGHRVPVSMRVVPLNARRPRAGGTLAVFRTDPVRGMAAELDELRSLALLDPLTKLPNRRFCEKVLASRLEEMRRYYAPFGVLFLDVDDFKQVNDTYGHHVGDRVLQMVASSLSNNCRLFDIVGRWGGEEFIAIIVNVGEQQLAVAAEKFRALIESASLPMSSGRLSVTVSVGGAVSDMDDTPATLVRRADSRMYASKAAGKNRATVSD